MLTRLRRRRDAAVIFLEVLVGHADRPADIRSVEPLQHEVEYLSLQLTRKALVCLPHVVKTQRGWVERLSPGSDSVSCASSFLTKASS